VPNLSPGKYTQISNPNARIEPFEVNTQTLMQYGQISQQNLGSMVMLIGSADQQMAMQGGSNGQGMSATPQGVDAQQAMVDITTNNYQKAIESFFSHYCSYALTMYFQELKAVKKVAPTAEARLKLLHAGLPAEAINEDGTLDVDFEELATEFWVRAVPGSLIEMEDEKQLRILNQLFVPLSQAMPALAASGDQQMIQQAARAMQYIVKKQIELSGASSAHDIGLELTGSGDIVDERDRRIGLVETGINDVSTGVHELLGLNENAIRLMQEQLSMQGQTLKIILEKLGAKTNTSSNGGGNPPQGYSPEPAPPSTLMAASA
jgi:hypothetical protein